MENTKEDSIFCVYVCFLFCFYFGIFYLLIFVEREHELDWVGRWGYKLEEEKEYDQSTLYEIILSKIFKNKKIAHL